MRCRRFGPRYALPCPGVVLARSGTRRRANVVHRARRALPCRGRGLDGGGGLAVLATPTAPTARAAGSLGHSPAGPARRFAHRWCSSRSCEGRGRLRRARRAVCRRAGRARSEDHCADAQEDAEPPAAAVGARARPSLGTLQVARHVESKAGVAGRRGPSGLWAEAGRGRRRPGARSAAARGLRGVRWPGPEALRALHVGD